mgnify:CR=1 FL=1
MKPVDVIRGTGPVILAAPHAGLFLPDEVVTALNETGRALADTDWHVDRLYEGLLPDATYVRARFSRYVIDANRDPSGQSLYPGQNTTGLCPTTDFDGASIYRPRREPDDEEVERRRRAFHAPYHAALEQEIARVKSLHGGAVLYDCHSIRSRISYLFEGVLPDFNVGTNEGRTCAPEIEDIVRKTCADADGYSSVVNGRFKGGWTTRHYGRPAENVHAIQMELAQSAYMEEAPPWTYSPEKAGRLRIHLRDILTAIDDFARKGLG